MALVKDNEINGLDEKDLSSKHLKEDIWDHDEYRLLGEEFFDLLLSFGCFDFRDFELGKQGRHEVSLLINEIVQGHKEDGQEGLFVLCLVREMLDIVSCNVSLSFPCLKLDNSTVGVLIVPLDNFIEDASLIRAEVRG